MSSGSEVVERQQYLAFTVAGGEYAAGILKVKEILQFEHITRVPSTPRSIRGVINLRGSVVPVVDLAVKFGLPEAEITNRSCVLVVEALRDGVPTVMGLIADAVSEVIALVAEDVAQPPDFGPRARVDYLAGMGKVGNRFVLLLDIDRVLSDDERDTVASLERGDAAGSEGGAPPVPSVPGVAAMPAAGP